MANKMHGVVGSLEFDLGLEVLGVRATRRLKFDYESTDSVLSLRTYVREDVSGCGAWIHYDALGDEGLPDSLLDVIESRIDERCQERRG
jgi:hypothetical protein